MNWLRVVRRQVNQLSPLIPQLQDGVNPDPDLMRELRSDIETRGDAPDDVIARMNSAFARYQASDEGRAQTAEEWYRGFLSLLIASPVSDAAAWFHFGKIMDGDDCFTDMVGDRATTASLARDDVAAIALCDLMDDLATGVGYVGFNGLAPSEKEVQTYKARILAYVGFATGRRSQRWPHRDRLGQISTSLLNWLGDPTPERVEVVVTATARMLDALQAELDQLPPA